MAEKYRICSPEIFISDEDIISNIAFGLKKENINQEKVIAAKIANLHNFINSLNDGYKTKIGRE